jgi:23S rRNA (uracil1939-C5)-methyltransferase
VKAGEKLVLTAGDLAFGAGTVCREPGGMIVFVPYLAPGDAARVVIDRVGKNHARGRAVEIVASGPDRVVPACPVYGTCGGCQWMHVSLAAQRAAKERITRHFLDGLGVGDRLGPIRSAGGGLSYRNRLILPVRGSGGGLRAGFYRAGSHDIVEIDSCAVQRPELWEAAATVLEIARAAGVPGYDENTGRGWLRHLLVRRGAGSGELGVVLVTTDEPFPACDALAREFMLRNPMAAGVARNVNPARTNVILGSRTHILAGRGYLNEDVGGSRFRASLPAFFQANAEVTALLVDQVKEWSAGTTGGLLDLYCGVGILGISAAMAQRKADGTGSSPAWLVGVEETPEAVADAVYNAGIHPGLKAGFETGSVEEVLPRLKDLPELETVILDPPRKGLTPAALRAVLDLPARRLIYVSCDPATLARDLKRLLEAGWKVEHAVPFDMFPQTWHIETAVLLTR